jgi:hypothetical protein
MGTPTQAFVSILHHTTSGEQTIHKTNIRVLWWVVAVTETLPLGFRLPAVFWGQFRPLVITLSPYNCV